MSSNITEYKVILAEKVIENTFFRFRFHWLGAKLSRFLYLQGLTLIILIKLGKIQWFRDLMDRRLLPAWRTWFQLKMFLSCWMTICMSGSIRRKSRNHLIYSTQNPWSAGGCHEYDFVYSNQPIFQWYSLLNYELKYNCKIDSWLICKSWRFILVGRFSPGSDFTWSFTW